MTKRPGSAIRTTWKPGHSASAFAFATAVSWQLPGLTPMLLSGTVLLLRARRPVPGIRVWHAPRLHVDADDHLEVTLDGEILGILPGDFEVAGEALRVITSLDFNDIDD